MRDAACYTVVLLSACVLSLCVALLLQQCRFVKIVALAHYTNSSVYADTATTTTAILCTYAADVKLLSQLLLLLLLLLYTALLCSMLFRCFAHLSGTIVHSSSIDAYSSACDI
jgi:hypothetical protein